MVGAGWELGPAMVFCARDMLIGVIVCWGVDFYGVTREVCLCFWYLGIWSLGIS